MTNIENWLDRFDEVDECGALVDAETTDEDVELFAMLIDEGLSPAQVLAYVAVRDKEAN